MTKDGIRSLLIGKYDCISKDVLRFLEKEIKEAVQNQGYVLYMYHRLNLNEDLVFLCRLKY